MSAAARLGRRSAVPIDYTLYDAPHGFREFGVTGPRGWDGPRAILMIGLRPAEETPHYPVSAVAARYGASAAKETYEPDEAYADWPGEYAPLRLPWPLL